MNKNLTKSSCKFDFLLVTLDENLPYGLATKMKLIHGFWWVGGVGWKCVTKLAENDHLQEKHCKLLISPIRRLYFVPITTSKHTLRKLVP